MKVEIIAELAQGFEGDKIKAKLLLKAAAVSGAHAAKFQLVYADELATPDYKYYNLFRSLEMEDNAWKDLADYAKELKIKLYLDVFGEKGLQLCEKIGVEAIKLHGTDMANIGLLNTVKRSSIKKVLLGAGGAHLSEIEQALEILNNKNIVVLLGYQSYPTPNGDNQIKRVSLLKEHLSDKYSNFHIGFADHADPNGPVRYALAIAAIGLGAAFIEKHLTLGRIMEMEDHESALNPDEFKEFIQTVEQCVLAISDSRLSEDFDMSESEKAYRKMIRRHVVTTTRVAGNAILLPEYVSLKRTSEDTPITDLKEVYNARVKRTIEKNMPVLAKDLDNI